MRRGVAYGAVLWTLSSGVGAAAVLERVTVRSAERTSVELALSARVVPWVRKLAATPDEPHRIYVDLPDTVLGSGVHKVLPAPAPGVERIRAGQFTSTTARIVLETTRDLAYDVSTSDRGLILTLRSADPPADREEPGPPAPGVRATPTRPGSAGGDRPAGASSAARGTPRELRLPLIVVDPGHGGHDPGAKGIDGVLEKTVALQIAHRLAAKLPARLPVDSLLTRSDDSYVPLSDRLPHGNTPNAIFLSLHANACDEPGPHGLEIFFAGADGGDDERRAKQLARFVTRELRARLLRVRGRPRPGPFRVLTDNHAPSVLIELGYLTHHQDAARLQDPHYQELLTDALVDAVAVFIESSPVHQGQVLVPSGNRRRAGSTRAASGSS